MIYSADELVVGKLYRCENLDRTCHVYCAELNTVVGAFRKNEMFMFLGLRFVPATYYSSVIRVLTETCMGEVVVPKRFGGGYEDSAAFVLWTPE